MAHGTRTESSVRRFGDAEHIRARPASYFTYFEAEPIAFFSDFSESHAVQKLRRALVALFGKCYRMKAPYGVFNRHVRFGFEAIAVT